MFKKHYIVTAASEKDAYRMMRIAANHNLYAQYKIGVYGTERQHELFVIGTPWNYHKFMNEISTSIEGSVKSKEEA